MDKQDIERQIIEFCSTFEKGKKYKVSEYIPYFCKITGACTDGIDSWRLLNNYDLNDEFTVDEFLHGIRGAYRPIIIKKWRDIWRAMKK